MGKAKSKGALLHDALVKVDLRDHEDWLGSPTEQPMFEQAAQEYEKAVAADLPADVDAFLAEVEARKPLVRVIEVNGAFDVFLDFNDYVDARTHHIFQVRKWADEACDRMNRDARGDVPVLLGIIRKMAASIAAFRERQAELRERLAKLETQPKPVERDYESSLNEQDDFAGRFGY